MATTIRLDDALVAEALRISGHKTKKAVVSEALEEYIKRRKQLKIRELFHTIDYISDVEERQLENHDLQHPLLRRQ